METKDHSQIPEEEPEWPEDETDLTPEQLDWIWRHGVPMERHPRTDHSGTILRRKQFERELERKRRSGSS